MVDFFFVLLCFVFWWLIGFFCECYRYWGCIVWGCVLWGSFWFLGCWWVDVLNWLSCVVCFWFCVWCRLGFFLIFLREEVWLLMRFVWWRCVCFWFCGEFFLVWCEIVVVVYWLIFCFCVGCWVVCVWIWLYGYWVCLFYSGWRRVFFGFFCCIFWIFGIFWIDGGLVGYGVIVR